MLDNMLIQGRRGIVLMFRTHARDWHPPERWVRPHQEDPNEKILSCRKDLASNFYIQGSFFSLQMKTCMITQPAVGTRSQCEWKVPKFL